MNVAVSASGQLMYSAANTPSQFTWMDRSGKRFGVVGEPADYGIWRLSPDGRRIAATRFRPGGLDLWLLDVARGVSSRFTDPSATNVQGYPVWSPDSRMIVFSAGFARHSLYLKDTEAATERPIIETPSIWLPLDWSRDGRFILNSAMASGTGVDLWTLPVTASGSPAADAEPTPYLRTAFYEGNGRFSPEVNPHWVAYTSDESGQYEVYIDTFPERRHKTPISTGGGQYPEWGPGGRELYYVSPDLKLMVASLKLGTDSVEPSAPRELFSLPATDNNYGIYQPTPDGQRFLVRATAQDRAGEPLTVIVNWPAMLEKGSAAQ